MRRLQSTNTLTMILGVVLGCLLAAGSACEEPRRWDDPGPESEFRKFLEYWYQNNAEKAFEMIDPHDRRELEEPVEEIDSLLGAEGGVAAHEMLVAGRLDNPYDVKSIEVEPKLDSKPAPGDRYRLELIYQDERTGSATMVWRDERWYVDLPLELARSPESGEGSAEGKGRLEDRSDAGPAEAAHPPDAEAAELGPKRD